MSKVQVQRYFWDCLSGESPEPPVWSHHNTEYFFKILANHKLLGYFYNRHQDQLQSPALKNAYKSQWLLNELFINEAKNMELVFKDKSISATLLKGQSLLGDIYSSGERFMCDIDLLVTLEDFEAACSLLKDMGYHEIFEKKWAANNFKAVFHHKKRQELCVEIHSRLFYQWDSGTWTSEPKENFQWFQKLSTEDLLVHLLGHLGYQHSFVRLHWFLDIDLLLRKQSENIDWDLVNQKLAELSQTRSAEIIFWVLKNYLKTPLKKHTPLPGAALNFWLTQFMTSDYILHPENYRRYFLFKHLAKDRLTDALEYDLRWAAQKLGPSPDTKACVLTHKEMTPRNRV